MDTRTAQEDLRLNESERLSSRQIWFLLRWFTYRVLGVTLPGLLIAIGLGNQEGFIIVIATCILTITFAWNYGLDLWERTPYSVVAQVKKEHTRVRGPTQYYLVFSEDSQTEHRIRVPKSHWMEIQEGLTYKLFFTKRTKWLLSYRVQASFY